VLNNNIILEYEEVAVIQVRNC